MQRKPQVETDDIFRALADPIRRSILTKLRQSPSGVGTLTRHYAISRPAISRHLKILRECHVVDVKSKGAENIYYLNPAPLAEVQDWLQQFWSSRLGELKALSEGQDS